MRRGGAGRRPNLQRTRARRTCRAATSLPSYPLTYLPLYPPRTASCPYLPHRIKTAFRLQTSQRAHHRRAQPSPRPRRLAYHAANAGRSSAPPTGRSSPSPASAARARRCRCRTRRPRPRCWRRRFSPRCRTWAVGCWGEVEVGSSCIGARRQAAQLFGWVSAVSWGSRGWGCASDGRKRRRLWQEGGAGYTSLLRRHRATSNAACSGGGAACIIATPRGIYHARRRRQQRAWPAQEREERATTMITVRRAEGGVMVCIRLCGCVGGTGAGPLPLEDELQGN
jgi:hypothetical protein